jgi:hypothetical protein
MTHSIGYFFAENAVRVLVALALFGSARIIAIVIDRVLLQRHPRLRRVLLKPLPGHGPRKSRMRTADRAAQ